MTEFNVIQYKPSVQQIIIEYMSKLRYPSTLLPGCASAVNSLATDPDVASKAI